MSTEAQEEDTGDQGSSEEMYEPVIKRMNGDPCLEEWWSDLNILVPLRLFKNHGIIGYVRSGTLDGIMQIVYSDNTNH